MKRFDAGTTRRMIVRAEHVIAGQVMLDPDDPCWLKTFWIPACPTGEQIAVPVRKFVAVKGGVSGKNYLQVSFLKPTTVNSPEACLAI